MVNDGGCQLKLPSATVHAKNVQTQLRILILAGVVFISERQPGTCWVCFEDENETLIT